MGNNLWDNNMAAIMASILAAEHLHFDDSFERMGLEFYYRAMAMDCTIDYPLDCYPCARQQREVESRE